jgi:hypothetical protein
MSSIKHGRLKPKVDVKGERKYLLGRIFGSIYKKFSLREVLIACYCLEPI